VATGVEEAMLEGPVLGQIHPAVVLVLPSWPRRRMTGAGKAWAGSVVIPSHS
jgi:hypothetical protein